MKNKRMALWMALILIAVLLLGCSKKSEKKADGHYLIGSKIKIYDGDLKPIDAYFTYLPPSYQWKYKQYSHKTILLNQSLGLGVTEAFSFTINEADKNEAIGFFRNSIDKSIEWAATAKKENVHSLKKEIPTPDGYKNKTFVTISQLLGNPPPTSITSTEPVDLWFTFYIGDFLDNGKEETLLIMLIRDYSTGRLKRAFCFRENDFALLKEIFSESYLAEIDKKEEALRKSQTEQDAKFK